MLTAAQRTKLRRQALDSLVAELTQVKQQIARGKKIPDVVRRLTQWQKDPSLISVRGEAKLKLLPKEQAENWRKFWGEVKQVLTPLTSKQAADKQPENKQ